jgi:2-methylisocitrate lyase-like PEP mutase family enzyme
MTRHDRVAAFRSLHQPQTGSILVLPNAWDALSSRIIEHAGARAIATTSAGVSWALGCPDGEGVSRAEMLAAVRRIVRAVRVPVSADVEGGYGMGTADDVAETVRGVIDAGAVGINLEDAPGRDGQPLLPVEQQQRRIGAARAAAGSDGLFINARVDVYLRSVGEEGGRLAETIRRARAYGEAGADGVFVPGVIDAATIRRLRVEIPLPLNVMAMAGAPPIGELARLGVARVSLGPAITLAAVGRIRAAAVELLGRGSYDALADGPSFAEVNGLFASEPAATAAARPATG